MNDTVATDLRIELQTCNFSFFLIRMSMFLFKLQ